MDACLLVASVLIRFCVTLIDCFILVNPESYLVCRIIYTLVSDEVHPQIIIHVTRFVKQSYARKVESTELVVILGHNTFTFVDLDGDGGLVIDVGGEGLLLLGGDRGVLGDQLGHDTTDGPNTQSQRSDVNDDNILATTHTRQDATLDGSTVGDGLIRIDTGVGFFTIEEVLDKSFDLTGYRLT